METISFTPMFWITIAVFITTYVIIISEKIHRTVVALSGALLMIILGILNQEQAQEGVDFNTLGLLIGMMIIVNIAKRSGMFEAVAVWAAKAVKGEPVAIFLMLGFITALFSAFLDNVTTVLLMVPVVLVVASNLKLNPKPFLISAILLSNIGGTSTLIGDPPNILVGSAVGIPFNDFIIHLAPIIVVVMLVTLGLLYMIYGKAMHTTPEAQASIMAFHPTDAISDWKLLIKSLIVIGVVILGFFTHGITHLEGATIALAGAAVLLLLTMHDPEEYLKEIEWTTIFFFMGLFIVVAGLEHVGAIKLLAGGLLTLTQGNPTAMTLAILWGSAVFSAVVDNIPFVATMIPLIKEIGVLSSIPLMPLWWALLLGADIGGNATLVGASANVVVSGIAEREGYRIGFFEYMKIAVPLTVVAISLCTVYMYLRYLA